MGIFKRGKIWYIDYYFAGKRIRKAVSTQKKIAELKLNEIKQKIAFGNFKIPIDITLKELIEKYLEYARQKKTVLGVKTDTYHLNNFLNFINNPEEKGRENI